jgi:hypothetical protein
MGFADDLLKAMGAKAAAKKTAGTAKAAPAKSTSKAKTKTTATKAKAAPAAKGGHNASAIEKKYPGGSWRTMRGHHIYIKADGSVARETLPVGMAERQEIKQAVAAKNVNASKAVKTSAKKTTEALKPGKATAQKLQKDKKGAAEAKAAADKQAARARKAAEKKRIEESPAIETTAWTRDQKTGENKLVRTKAEGKVIGTGAKYKEGTNTPDTIQQEASGQVANLKEATGEDFASLQDKVAEMFGEMPNEGRTHSGDFKLPKIEMVKTASGRQVPRLVRAYPDGPVQFEKLKHVTEEDFINRMEGMTRHMAKKFMQSKGLDHVQTYEKISGIDTGYFSDLAQEFRTGLLEGVREWNENKENGNLERLQALRDPSNYAIARAQQRMSRYGNGMFDQIKLPRELRGPLAMYHQAVKAVAAAGGTADRKSIGAWLDKNKPEWADVKLLKPGKRGEYLTATGDKVAAMESLYHLNKTTSLDRNVSDADSPDKAIAKHEQVAGENDTERQAMAGEVRKAQRAGLNAILNDAGLSKDELAVVQARHGLGSGMRAAELVDFPAVAQALGLSHDNARQRYSRALKKLQAHVQKNPDAVSHIKELVMKGFGLGNTLLKALFEADLDEALGAYGLDRDVCDWAPTRQVLVKSLDGLADHLPPTEYVMTMVKVPGEGILLTLAEPILPADSLLEKAIAMADFLEKSMGTHGHLSAVDRTRRNQKVRDWVRGAGRERFESHVKDQQGRLQGKTGALTWSEQLLQDNPGSAWITWGGHHILIQGGDNPSILYDSGDADSGYNPESGKHQEFDDEGEVRAEHNFHEKTEDVGEEIAQQDAEAARGAKTAHVTDDVNELRRRFMEHRDQFRSTDDFKQIKEGRRYLPPGHYMATGPDGKRVAFEIKLGKAADKGAKGGEGLTSQLGDVWSIDDAEGKGVSKHESSYGTLLGMLYGTKGGQEAYDKVHGTTGGKKGLMLPELLEKWAYGNDYADKNTHKLAVLTEDEWNGVLSKTDNAAADIQRKAVKKELSRAEDLVPKVADDGSVTFKKRMPDGRIATYHIGADGQPTDPVMRQLLNTSSMPNGIQSQFDLDFAITQSIGRKAWVTVSPSQWAVGKGAHHHIQLQFNGLGAPTVVGGPWDGKIYADAADLTDPAEKAKALFKNGKLVEGSVKTTAMKKVAHEQGNAIKFRLKGQSKWQEGVIDHEYVHDGEKTGAYRVRIGDQLLRISPDNAQITHARQRDTLTGSLPLLDWGKDHLVAHVPEAFRQTFAEDLKLPVDKNGQAKMSLSQFEKFREVFGGFTLTDKADEVTNKYLEEQSRPEGFLTKEERAAKYQPADIIAAGGKKAEALKRLLKEDSTKLTTQKFYDTQLQGVHFLRTRKRGVAGHGMGTGKTQLGVLGILDKMAEAEAAGLPQKKSVIVAPSGIRSDWLKEFKRHTNVKVAVVGGPSGGRGGMFGTVTGSEDLRAPYLPHSDKAPLDMSKVDHDVVVVSQDFFAKNAHLFTGGDFDTMVLDEVHNLKKPDGSRGTALQDVAGAKGVQNVWGLSGTPMENDPTELWNLVNMGTMGQHGLGSKEEFLNNFFERKGGKVIRVHPDKMEDLGKTLAKYVQFRKGEDVGVEFPEITRPEGVVGEPNPYHGAKVPVHPYFNPTTAQLKSGADYTMYTPDLNQVDPDTRQFYDRYYKLENDLLGANELSKLRGDAATGYDNGSGSSATGYLSGVNKLQQFMNAPDAWEALHRHTDYARALKNAGDEGDAGAEAAAVAALHTDPKTGFHGVMDNGKFIPLHQNSPMAKWVGDRIRKHLDANRELNQNRRAAGESPVPPKVVLSSQYVALGTKVLENVVNELKRDYPELRHATYTGEDDAVTRDQGAATFNDRNGPNVMIMSSAAKEGKDFGTGQLFISLDHEWNPQRTAQKVARTRRSDSKGKRAALGADNRVSVESPFLPGTIHNDILNAHDRKVGNIQAVENATRAAEGFVGDAAQGPGYKAALAGEHKRFGAQATDKVDPVEAARRKHDTLTRQAADARKSAGQRYQERTRKVWDPDKRKMVTEKYTEMLSSSAWKAHQKNLTRQAEKFEAQAARLREKHGFTNTQERELAVAKSFGLESRVVRHVIVLGGRRHG